MTRSDEPDRPRLGAESDTVASRSGTTGGEPLIPRDVPADEYGEPSERPVAAGDVPDLPGGGPPSGRRSPTASAGDSGTEPPAEDAAEAEPGADLGPSS